MRVDRAEAVLHCPDPDAAARALGELGFAVEMVIPADAPDAIVIAGHGTRVRLVRGDGRGTATLRLTGDPARVIDAAGVRVEIEPPAQLVVPACRVKLAISRGGAWHRGRAGMQYRDLLPDRLGGWLIASHIRIDEGGPVPDYVHHHGVRVQLIYCRTGWVKLVYEDQGEPFVMEAGDCVTQPPGIRHRVLECSPGLEVIELASPAMHATYADRELALPTAAHARERAWSGQRFVWHRARTATWHDAGGWQARDLGLDAPTAGLASGRVLRGPGTSWTTNPAVTFGFVLGGAVSLRENVLAAGDAFVVPPDEPCALDGDAGAELLEITLA